MARGVHVVTQFEEPSAQRGADNYAGAAIFRVGAPAKQNVRAFSRHAQEEYSGENVERDEYERKPNCVD
jgi:hypothetical protein